MTHAVAVRPVLAAVGILNKIQRFWNGPGVTSYGRSFSASLNALFIRWFVIEVSLL